MRSIMIAAWAAVFLLPVSAQAARAPVGGVVTQFCGDKYGQCASASVSLVKVRMAKRKLGRSGWHRMAKGMIRLARVGALPRALSAFIAPLGAICAPVMAPITVGVNILHAFHDRLASIVEPVRPGFVAIQTASGKRAVVASSIAPRFVAFIRDLEATGYRILDIGGYAYRRIAGTRTLSKHAFGMAIDINQDARDVVTVPMNRRAVSRLASANNLCSGGDWRRPDLGHFERCDPVRSHRHAHKRVRMAMR